MSYCFLLQSCEELVLCLSVGDFADFTAQLEGLTSIYQLNAEKKVKCKAFSALQSLEADLGTLATLQSFIKEPFNLVHKSPVGILEKRRGGMFFNNHMFAYVAALTLVFGYGHFARVGVTCGDMSSEILVWK